MEVASKMHERQRHHIKRDHKTGAQVVGIKVPPGGRERSQQFLALVFPTTSILSL
jgi:hypothetical protein